MDYIRGTTKEPQDTKNLFSDLTQDEYRQIYSSKAFERMV